MPRLLFSTTSKSAADERIARATRDGWNVAERTEDSSGLISITFEKREAPAPTLAPDARVRSLVLLDDGEELAAGAEGTIIEARATRRGLEYVVDFDGSAFESSVVSADEIEEIEEIEDYIGSCECGFETSDPAAFDVHVHHMPCVAGADGFRAVYAPAEKMWRWMNTDTSIIAGRGDTPELARADAAQRAPDFEQAALWLADWVTAAGADGLSYSEARAALVERYNIRSAVLPAEIIRQAVHRFELVRFTATNRIAVR